MQCNTLTISYMYFSFVLLRVALRNKSYLQQSRDLRLLSKHAPIPVILRKITLLKGCVRPFARSSRYMSD